MTKERLEELEPKLCRNVEVAPTESYCALHSEEEARELIRLAKIGLELEIGNPIYADTLLSNFDFDRKELPDASR